MIHCATRTLEARLLCLHGICRERCTVALYLGIDVGTTKVAAVVVDAATGEQVAVASMPEPGPLPAAPGHSEWDAAAMLDRALQAGRQAVAASGRAGEFAGV